MKRRLLPLLLAACTLLLCGCGSLFDREYLSVTDYTPPAQEIPTGEESAINVRNPAELRRALGSLIDERAEEGRIVFDASYTGDINADIASASWQIRTQDALYAYCVENISYDVSKIVSHYEARITIRYTAAGRDRDSIVRLQLTNELEEQVRAAIERGDTRLVVLVARSSYSAEDVENLASRVYRENPASEPREPRVTVNMLSGTGMQRLYEINFQYSLTQEELADRREALKNVAPFVGMDSLPEDPTARALMACRYLVDASDYSENGPSDIYSALVLGEANSEGLALGYVELCRQVNVPCQIVYGQRDWRNCCWNIIQINGEYYHVDVTVCMEEGMVQGFLLRDQTMWGRYRWDISSYPPCSGSLHYEEPAENEE